MHELKVKTLSLAAEARIIKSEEDREKHLVRKWKEKARVAATKAIKEGRMIDTSRAEPKSKALHSLHHHRVNDVRKEARCAALAYGYLLGRSYQEMENFSWTQPNWERVEKLAVRYSGVDPRVETQRFAEWKSEALGGATALPFYSGLQPGSVRSFDSLNPMQKTWVEVQRIRNEAETEGDAVEAVEALIAREIA